MKKPSKNLLLAYLIWCSIHVLMGIANLLQGGWTIDEYIWPFASLKIDGYYDIVEIILYCGLPLLIWIIYNKIIDKHYD
ncbi:MAG: hypothetical protein ABFC55_00940 [Tenuifilaceae bacterium]